MKTYRKAEVFRNGGGLSLRSHRFGIRPVWFYVMEELEPVGRPQTVYFPIVIVQE